MALDALAANGITQRVRFLLTDRALTPRAHPLRRVRASRVALFTAVQLAGFGATFAVTQTVGACFFFGYVSVCWDCCASVCWGLLYVGSAVASPVPLSLVPSLSLVFFSGVTCGRTRWGALRGCHAPRPFAPPRLSLVQCLWLAFWPRSGAGQ
jgi:hypothetical protein